MPDKISVKQALSEHSRLENSDTPQLDCQIILGYCLDKNRAWLIAHDEYVLSSNERETFNEALNARASSMPIAYIRGSQEFWSLSFEVNQSTLIPRPETELIVENILERFPNQETTLIDLGTGAGPIAISIASERPLFRIVATDLSQGALEIAGKNAERLLKNNTIQFVQCSWLDGFENEYFDIIVSNPPYIPPGDEHLPALQNEPYAALVAKDKGFADFKLIIEAAQEKLKSGGMIILEHGFDQQSILQKMLNQYHFTNIELLKDLAGHARAILAYKK